MYVTGSNIQGQIGFGNIQYLLKPANLLLPITSIPISNHPNDEYHIKHIECGYYHTIFVTDTNELFSMGDNDSGQIGIGIGIDSIVNKTEKKIKCIRKPKKILFERVEEISQIICGHSFSILVLNNQELYVFGNNASGQLGLNERIITKYQPYQNPFFQPSSTLQDNMNMIKIKSIGSGGNHTIIIYENQKIYGFGNNKYGQLLTKKYLQVYQPIEIQHELENPIKVKCGFFFTIIVNKGIESDELWGVGENYFGQLGIGSLSNQYKLRKIEFVKNFRVEKIECGDDHTMMLTVDGDLYVWGRNKYGNLGLGHNEDILKPRLLKSRKLKGKKIIDLRCSGNFSVILVEDKEKNQFIMGCGANKHGQLSLGHRNYLNSLHSFQLDRSIRRIVSGYSHCCYVLDRERDVVTKCETIKINDEGTLHNSYKRLLFVDEDIRKNSMEYYKLLVKYFEYTHKLLDNQNLNVLIEFWCYLIEESKVKHDELKKLVCNEILEKINQNNCFQVLEFINNDVQKSFSASKELLNLCKHIVSSYELCIKTSAEVGENFLMKKFELVKKDIDFSKIYSCVINKMNIKEINDIKLVFDESGKDFAYVNKSILADRSKLFCKLLISNDHNDRINLIEYFKEYSFIDKSVVRCVIEFICTGRIEIEKLNFLNVLIVYDILEIVYKKDIVVGRIKTILKKTLSFQEIVEKYKYLHHLPNFDILDGLILLNWEKIVHYYGLKIMKIFNYSKFLYFNQKYIMNDQTKKKF